ncbi:Lrp/AsnC family transcriptional regulator [Marivirga arenosa]|uniref:Lrp/AsnC family transcriptional regulator n=1 Tax=Marivirga arenosa TaxID=3059076 RepID=A0AA51N5P7_9BACT|nr:MULTISPECIES: Lrp/AsnC family transcriptional regulator [unclassified Marivirga]WMN06717.1 Lrp/AsnC family transcriptional regulator [Marivirga sp. ABR2-2]WNB16955.1 Lrp/AsnC family transcriptional regulator [Marivirga sp. BKB1-2]
MLSFKLDQIDKKILDILQVDGRITNAQLSKDIGLSPAPTLERVKKLENAGIIKSYHAKLDTEKINLGVSTYVMVSLKGHNKSNIDKFIEAIDDVDEIIECNHVTGSSDFILKVIAKDIPSYQKLMLEKVSEIEVVDSMQSMVILSTFKDSKRMPIPENN